MLLCFCW